MKKFNKNILFIATIIVSSWFFIGCGAETDNQIQSISPSSSVVNGESITLTGKCNYCLAAAASGCASNNDLEIESVTFTGGDAIIKAVYPESKFIGADTMYQIKYTIQGNPGRKVSGKIICTTNPKDGEVRTVSTTVTFSVLPGSLRLESLPPVVMLGDVVPLKVYANPTPISDLNVKIVQQIKNIFLEPMVIRVVNQGCTILAGQNSCTTSLTVDEGLFPAIYNVNLEAAVFGYAPSVASFTVNNIPPGPTPTPTVEPTVTPTVTPTVAPTTEPTAEPTVEPTVEPTIEPTVEPTRKIIFVTESSYSGNLEGLAGADAKCNSDNSKPNGSAYKALINGNNATQVGVVYIRSFDSKIIATATSGNLVGESALQNAIANNNPDSWTAAVSETNCKNWTSSSASDKGRLGRGGLASSVWWSDSDAPCGWKRFLYCVEQ